MEQVQTLIGRGIYDVSEIALLVGRSPAEVTGWATGSPALLRPRNGRLFGFYDLVTAVVVAELRRRGVPLRRIRDTRDWLTVYVPDVDWPIAHAAGLKMLASVGRRVFFRPPDEEWIDASAGGQQAFAAVVKPLIRHLSFDELGMASEWRPVKGVVLDPAVQAGSPCLDGTRVPTSLIAELVAAGENPRDIAEDYSLDLALVKRAARFEDALRAA